MEEQTAVKNIQKFQSGSIYILISKKARLKLQLKPRDTMVEKVDVANGQLIFEREPSITPP